MIKTQQKLHVQKITDGLGICRSCTLCDKNNVPDSIGIGTDDWYRPTCRKSKKPCHLTRHTLISCFYFKPLIVSRTNFLYKLWLCFLNNDWRELK